MISRIIYITILSYIMFTHGYKGYEEYCSFETFRAQCHDNQIILITYAQYGSMRIGKCVKSDLGQLGCCMNALRFLDPACSGKASCKYYVGGEDLAATKPCPIEFSSYLEVAYECIPAATTDPSYPCARNAAITLDSSFGYIYSEYAQEHGWGTVQCPWKVNALAGQSINVTMISFYTDRKGTSCKPIGFVTDYTIHQNITVCHSADREVHIMQSVGHVVVFQFLLTEEAFFLKYEVVGCADLVAPDHAWHRRVDHVATIGCEHGNKTWHLKCVGNVWHGVVGNCSSQSVSHVTEVKSGWQILQKGLPFTIIIIGVVAATLLVAICIILLALRPTCCCKRQPKPDSYPHFDANSVGTSYGYASNEAHTRSSWACTFKSGANTSNHIWETPLPEPSAPPATEHMLAATMRHPNPMETSITSSGGDYTWPTRFMAPSNGPQDLHSADYSHPSISISQQQSSSNDDYTVPVTEALLQDNKNEKDNTLNQDDYMAPSDIKPLTIKDNCEKFSHPHLPSDTFKRHLNNILHDNTSPKECTEDISVVQSDNGVAFNADAMVEYAIPNNKRNSHIINQEQQLEEEEYTLPANMRPLQSERNIPSAEQI